MVRAISKERLRQILNEEDITFQKTKSWKESPDPEKEDKLARIEEVMESCPDRVFAFDELGPLNLVPTPGVCWAERKRPQRLPANYHKFSGVRQFFACYHVGQDQLWGRMEKRKGRRPTLRALKGMRERVPKRERIYVILDNLNHHKGKDVRRWASDNNVELLFTPTYASWANPIECHLGAIRHFVLKNCNYPSHRALAARPHAYLGWRNAHRRDPKLLRVVRAEQRRIRAERMLRKAA